ncbi:hypothetical protein [Flavobacterium johnsoniae]|nr:hypothetical protein [Flavobacterium johnsoniae]
MNSERKEALKNFYVSNHGIGIHTILIKLKDRTDPRTLATPRLLGLLNDSIELTEVGLLFTKQCYDKKRILLNQYKKWHFPNNVNFKGDSSNFNIFPYWIILEFLVLANKKGIIQITAKEFMAFVSIIRDRDDINYHLSTLDFIRKNSSEEKPFYDHIPDKDNFFQRFSKSGFHELLGDCLEYISYDNSTATIFLNNTDLEFLINEINYFYKTYDIFKNHKNDTDYLKFLRNNTIDNTFNILPMANSFSSDLYGTVAATLKNEYKYLNVLLKGVPGTGKSREFEEIINNEIFALKSGEVEDTCLTIEKLKNKNVIRINVHSGLNNSELMQGIGVISTDTNEIKYYEKRGIVLKHIAKAILNPSLPYVIILEEVQENNLNRLIGDLIFLIESNRRVVFSEDFLDKLDSEIDFGFVSDLVLEKANDNKVILPSLVEDSQDVYMCIPKNLYFFCTSNYRDDKKIMEDNLLRRFEVVDIFPDFNAIKSEKVQQYFRLLNESILVEFIKNYELHPDRFLIGHAIWIDVSDSATFCQALNKVLVDFKDLKEIDWNIFKNILISSDLAVDYIRSYQELTSELQNFYFRGNALANSELIKSIENIFKGDD